LTNYVGELVQHDTSHHVWAPLSGVPWSLITTIDDCSRNIFYGDLWEKESSWAHIAAAKSLVMGFGCPSSYYVDNHAIFRFNERIDTIHRRSLKGEDEAKVQWKEVLTDLGIKVIYALSPAAKGKVERPYRWIQDHLVRVCVRENISRIEEAREVLYQELNRYNNHRVHSTTGEIPIVRFEKALAENRSLFSAAKIREPYKTWDDIFCLRWERVVNPYRKISIYNLEFPAPDAPIGSRVEIRVSFDMKKKLAKLRLWHKTRLVGEFLIKAEDLKKVLF